ncbi:MAG: hypothetical protein ACYCSO_00840 [Cuniculiplasma sp.]
MRQLSAIGRRNKRHGSRAEVDLIGVKQPNEIRNGFLTSIISIALLWWIPVGGPLLSGYVTGRKAGSAKNSLEVSLIMSAVIIFVSLYMISTGLQAVSLAGYYLKDGIYAFSRAPLASYSNLVVYTETFNGILVSMGLILPSSLIIFNATSFLGGTMSTTAKEQGRWKMPASRNYDYRPEERDELKPLGRGYSVYDDNPYSKSRDIKSWSEGREEEEPIPLSKL